MSEPGEVRVTLSQSEANWVVGMILAFAAAFMLVVCAVSWTMGHLSGIRECGRTQTATPLPPDLPHE